MSIWWSNFARRVVSVNTASFLSDRPAARVAETHASTAGPTATRNEICAAVWAEVSTHRQIVFVRIEEVVEVVDGHHQVGLVDQAGGGHAVVAHCPLCIWAHTRTNEAVEAETHTEGRKKNKKTNA